MSEEREKATFDVRELTYFLDGGEKFTKIREKFMMELERDPTFRMYDMYDVTKDQIRERTMEKVLFPRPCLLLIAASRTKKKNEKGIEEMTASGDHVLTSNDHSPPIHHFEYMQRSN